MLKNIQQKATWCLHRLSDSPAFGVCTFLTLVFFYLSRYWGHAQPFLWLALGAGIFPYAVDDSIRKRLSTFYANLVLFYGLLILISFLMHYAALKHLPSESYLTVERHQVGWGLRYLWDLSQRYMLFPAMLIAGIASLSCLSKSISFLIQLPILFLPSLLVALYQGVVDKHFINPSGLEIPGLSMDASAFGICLYLLIPLGVLGCITERWSWKRIGYIQLTTIMIMALMLRGQRTTFIGIFLFFMSLPFLRLWVKQQYNLFSLFKIMLYYVLMLVLGVGTAIGVIRFDTKHRFYLVHEIVNHINDAKENGIAFVYRRKIEPRIEKAQVAATLAAEAPLAGFGPGGFYMNLNNIRFRQKNPPIVIHNAANHYLQLASELGGIGMVLNLLLHIIPLGHLYRVRRNITTQKERWAAVILFTTVAIYMALYITGPHGLSLDVLWVTVAYLVTLIRFGGETGNPAPLRSNKRFIYIGLLLTTCFVFGSYQTSFGRNGIKSIRSSRWWPLKKQYGLYPDEKWDGRTVRWTAKKTLIRQQAFSDIIGIKLLVAPYNVAKENDLEIKLYVNKTFAGLYHFFDPGIQYFYRYYPNMQDTEAELRIEVDRTFNPSKLGINRDDRDLGIAVGPIQFLQIMPEEGIGFYNWENGTVNSIPDWPRDVPLRFRWTNIQATLNLATHPGGPQTLYLMCAHPDIKTLPVKVYLRSDHGNKIEAVFRDNAWRPINMNIYPKEADFVTIRVSRTWNPNLLGHSSDTRDLGVAVAVQWK